MLVFQGTPYLFTLQCWLLPNTDCSLIRYALQILLLVLAGANATTARCMAACMELLAWTELTRAQGAPAWWRGPHNWLNEWPWDNGATCAVRGPLKRTWYAASWPLASHHSLPRGSSSPRSPPLPWHAPWGLCKPLLLPVLVACSCDAALSWGSRGWLATFALHHTAPLWLNLHCKPVRPHLKGTCCPPLEGQGWHCPGHGAACHPSPDLFLARPH